MVPEQSGLRHAPFPARQDENSTRKAASSGQARPGVWPGGAYRFISDAGFSARLFLIIAASKRIAPSYAPCGAFG